MFWKHYLVLSFIVSLPESMIYRWERTQNTQKQKVSNDALFLGDFGDFSQKWRFYRKKSQKISLGTTFEVVTNKLDQKHNWWRKVGGKNFWSWTTSLCPNDHFWLYILYIFHIYAIFVIFGLNKPKMTKFFWFSERPAKGV